MIKIVQFKNNRRALIVSLVSLLLIGMIDYLSGTEIALSIFYLIPVLLFALQNTIGIRHIYLNALLAAIIWFVAEFITGHFSHILFTIWNSFVRFAIFAVVSHLAFNLNQKHQNLVAANNKLELLNDEKNKLIGVAAHDLRNPIANIYAFSDLLLTGYSGKTDPKVLEIMNYIKLLSSNTLDMLEKLLDISQIESGTVSLSMQQKDYINFLKNHIALNQMFAEKKGITISFKPPKESLYLAFDEHYLTEVINNLLTNAIKFSYPDTEIIVNVNENKNYIKTEVKDNGPGIPENEQKKLFQYFQKTSVKPTAGEKSSGLGLAIAKKIVMEHDGTIGVESQPGKGSTFYYELPLNKNSNKLNRK